MVIGFGPGGGYDLWGRTVGRHIGKHLPGNPSVVPQNMPGAGSYVAASHIYNAAPKDGTVIGIIARDAALGPLTGAPGARFDATKFSWLGSPATEHNVCIANAHRRGEDRAGPARQGVDPGRHRARHRHALLSEGAQRPARLQVQAGERLPLLGRRVPGDGARRGRRHLREPRQHPQPAAGLDSAEEGDGAAAGRGRAASQPAGRAVRARSCAQRRGAAGAGISLRRAGHRPAVRGAARPAARAAEDAARRLQRDHEGRGVPRRRQAAASSRSSPRTASTSRR